MRNPDILGTLYVHPFPAFVLVRETCVPSAHLNYDKALAEIQRKTAPASMPKARVVSVLTVNAMEFGLRYFEADRAEFVQKLDAYFAEKEKKFPHPSRRKGRQKALRRSALRRSIAMLPSQRARIHALSDIRINPPFPAWIDHVSVVFDVGFGETLRRWSYRATAAWRGGLCPPIFEIPYDPDTSYTPDVWAHYAEIFFPRETRRFMVTSSPKHIPSVIR